MLFLNSSPVQFGAADTSVRAVQQALYDVYIASGKQEKFRPPTVDGELSGDNGSFTTWALLQVALDSRVRNLPLVGDLLGLIQSVLGPIMSAVDALPGDPRNIFYGAWTAGIPRVASASEVQRTFTDFIRNQASKITMALNAVTLFFAQAPTTPDGTQTTRPDRTTTAQQESIQRVVYQGAFAVRDPSIGKYRIFKPVGVG